MLKSSSFAFVARALKIHPADFLDPLKSSRPFFVLTSESQKHGMILANNHKNTA